MNSMKFFNFKFFKENCKQAKGLIIFFLGLLPLITIIVLIQQLMSQNYVQNFQNYGLATYFLSFLIPVALALALFGFVFKKKSVDFYLAQPLNRKTIFLTNYLGGLALLLLIIIMNTIILAIFGAATELVLPFKMLLDYFVYFTVTYFFIFSIVTLAISLAGNFITSLILSILIIALVPFLKAVNWTYKENGNQIRVYCNAEICPIKNNQDKEYHYLYMQYDLANYNFTTPVALPFIADFRVGDVVRTIILTIIYSLLAFISFTRRPMENNECSFKNNFVYHLVKCLTLLPFGFLCFSYLTMGNYSGWLIFLVISLIYFLAYDLIAQKRIKPLPLVLFTFIISMSLYHGMYALWLRIQTKDIYMKDITSIKINYNDLDLVITEPDEIQTFLGEGLNIDGRDYYSYKAKIEYHKQTYTTHLNLPGESFLTDYQKRHNLKSNVETTNYAKITDAFVSFWGNDLKIKVDNKLINLLEDNKTKAIKEKYNFATLELYYYENHELKHISYNVGRSEELANFVAHYINQEFLKHQKSFNFQFINLYNEEATDIYEQVLEYFISKNPADFLKYLKDHQNDPITDHKYIIAIAEDGSLKRTFAYLVSDSTTLENLYNEYLEKYANDPHVQELIAECQENEMGIHEY